MIYLMYPMQNLTGVEALCCIMVLTLLLSLKGHLAQVRVTDDDGQHSSVSMMIKTPRDVLSITMVSGNNYVRNEGDEC